MNKTRWIIFSVVTVVVLILLVSLSGNSRLDVSSVDPNAVQKGNSQNGNIGDHVFGKAGSKVTLIEYGDFQCSICGEAYPVIGKVKEEYKDQLQFIFRNFPIGGAYHPYSMVTAAAAEAAGLQGKYWDMYDIIYKNQGNWTNLSSNEASDAFESYARTLGLDIKKYNTDKSSKRVTDKINFDKAIGQKIQVSGTPTLFLNGRKIELPWNDAKESEKRLKEAINQELKKAGIPLPASEK